MKRDRLLVIDDVPDNLWLLRTLLEDEGYEVMTASSAHQALDSLKSGLPDLILLDVMMPEMDGYELTQHIRAMRHLPFIPILLITAYDRASVAKGLDLGADDFIHKPVEVEDLYARVRSLLRLKHSIEERDHIARQRQDFVSRLTHDLRTPLVSADRMLGLLQDGALGELPSAVQEVLTVMARSNRNLLEMVNKLLDVYRYEAGSKSLSLSSLDLATLVQEIVAELLPIAQDKRLDLLVEPFPRGMVVTGDRLELRRVFQNLIGNALKFTEIGKVVVRGTVNEHVISVTIQDTGVGIAAAAQTRLFQRFQQGDSQKQGSGLGLYLSHYIIAAHGGKIVVHSVPDQGSQFTVILPHPTSADAAMISATQLL
ncbi:MAG: hybrid sensor histidine kinase/response regulator [Oscillatoriales cyanobacterium SM2_2_1]|nr:hybrid sensor histidine kinase/response regulator [Oscillatoriales cyanobacterium SM2_2_1]